MYTLQSRYNQESAIVKSARLTYRTLRGIYRLMRAVKNQLLNLTDQPIIILLYHRVTVLEEDPEMLAVSPENFRHQMEYLKRMFRILRFEENWSDSEKPAVVITFDDGYADNVLEALPILEEVGVPATFFISTAHIGTRKKFWWDELEAILLQDGELPSRFELKDAGHRLVCDTGTIQQRRKLYDKFNMLMHKVSPDRIDDWLDQLKTWAGPDRDESNPHRSLTKEEIKKLAASPWAAVGAHTVSHSALSALSEEQQSKEIYASKRTLEEITGTEIMTFSYPFGRKRDYNHASVRLCREAGFIKAASNFPGQVHRWTDPFQLPRHLVRNWDLDTFAAELKGFWTR